MTSVDESLREQSKLLLRKLKDKQSKLQDIVNTSLSEDPSFTEAKSPSITYVKKRTDKPQVKKPVRRLDDGKMAAMNVKEQLDTSLKKSVQSKSAKEGRARLHKRRNKSKENKEATNTKNRPRSPEEEKENLVQKSEKKESMPSKVIDVTSCSGEQSKHDTYPNYPMSFPTSRDTNTELSDIRNEVEAEFMENLKLPKEVTVNGDNRPEISDKTDDASGRAATPNTVRRRRIIDRNVRVDGPSDLNASELMREVEEEFPRLNYSYSNVEDSDLKFLQSRLRGASGLSNGASDDGPPTHDTNNGATYSSNLDNPGNSREVAKILRETKKPKSILLSSSGRANKSGTSNSSRVSFRSPTRDNSGHLSYSMDSFSKQQQKMLGYDWIAALIENDHALVDQSETFFDELKEFRRLNLDECVNQMYMSGPNHLWEHPESEPEPVQRALEETKVKPYVVNDRLFAEPVKKSLFSDYDYQEREPIQVPEREPTYEEPRFARVSIPRSTLQATSRVKPHRRNSFDAADSMALSKHCLKGWNTNQPSTMPTSKNIALRDSTTGIKSAMKTTLDDAEKLAANYPYEWDPKEQSICRPPPRTVYRPEEKYDSSVWGPTALRSNLSSFGQSSQSLQKATDELLNSTHSLMYEMKRLKMERSDDPIRL